jgi:hypothetical protein
MKTSKIFWLSNALLGLLVLALFNNMAPFGAGTNQEPTSFSSFQRMNVCLDTSGRVLPEVAPGDANCFAQRDILSAEMPTYRLHNYAHRRCSNTAGSIARVQIPIRLDGGSVRFVSYTDRGATQCTPNSPVVSPNANFGMVDAGEDEGFSIQWLDREYAFTMASWSPVSVSYWLTRSCDHSTSRDSRRFFRGWLLAPSALSKIPKGGVGYTVTASFMQNPSEPEGRRNRILPPGQCPDEHEYRDHYVSWFRTDFSYGSAQPSTAKRFDSIISDRYPRQVDRQGPGQSQNFERTYWTDEYGLSRWEKWATESYFRVRGEGANKTKIFAPQFSRELFQAGGCSRPADTPASVSPRHNSENLVFSSQEISEVHIDPVTKERKTFYLVFCNDYTRVVRGRMPDFRTQIRSRAESQFWE